MWTAPGYPRSWGDLRRRDLLFWFFVLSYVPGMVLIIVLVNDFPRSVPEHGTYFSVAWLTGFAGASFYRQSFRCPRCGQLFFRRMRLIEPSARKCSVSRTAFISARWSTGARFTAASTSPFSIVAVCGGAGQAYRSGGDAALPAAEFGRAPERAPF